MSSHVCIRQYNDYTENTRLINHFYRFSKVCFLEMLRWSE